MPVTYRGRFAPSPTGPLHFGSLVAAVASYADARAHGGEWLVRLEDVDETRCSREHEYAILAGLERFGMLWDGEPVRQSDRKKCYDDVLTTLADQQAVYRCICSRKQIHAIAPTGKEGPVYPGTCRARPPPRNTPAAWRMQVEDRSIGFDDRICERVEQNLATDIGDFVIRRVDGFTAYQLAVVVDDHDQGITHVVRGADLLWSTPRQLWLQQRLGFAQPRYAHVPLVYGENGQKLSKRDKADPIDVLDVTTALVRAWVHLGQPAPPRQDSVDAFWQWAVPRWHIGQIPRQPVPDYERTDRL